MLRRNANTGASRSQIILPASDEVLDEKTLRERFGRKPAIKTCNQRVQQWGQKTFSKSCLKSLFPPATWLPSYSKNNITGDLVAGITVAIVVVPQALSYAALALLNPVVGLYTSIFPSFIYMLLGTSRECHIGPFALVSLLTADGVTAFVENAIVTTTMNGTEIESQAVTAFNLTFPDMESASLNAATTLALLVGMFQIAFGIFGIGQIVMSVISDPFVSGFTTGSAFLIGASQMAGVFDVSNYRSNTIFITVYEVLKQVGDGEANWASFTIGIICIALLFISRHINKTVLAGKIPLPGELIVVVIAILASYFGNFEENYNVTVVGTIDSAFKAPAVPQMNGDMVLALLGPAFIIAFVGYMVSIAVAKLFADKNDYDIDGTQELVAMGCANAVGCFFGCYPAAASLSRTAIVDSAGAKSQLHNLYSAVIVVVVLVALSPFLSALPKATLSAIVYIALVGLFLGFRKLKGALELRWQDGAIWIVAFLATILGGVTVGIGVGVGFSLLLLLQRISRPYNAILGRVPGTVAFRSVKRFEVEQMQNVKIFRFDASLGFVNRSFFEECVLRVADGIHSHSKYDHGQRPKIIIIQCSSINSVDISALKSIAKLVKRLKKRGTELLLCSAKWDVRTLLRRAAKQQRKDAEAANRASHGCGKTSNGKSPKPTAQDMGTADKGIEMQQVSATAESKHSKSESENAEAANPPDASEEAVDATDGAIDKDFARREDFTDIDGDDAFAVVTNRNIFSSLSDALKFIAQEYGYEFERGFLNSPTLDFHFENGAGFHAPPAYEDFDEQIDTSAEAQLRSVAIGDTGSEAVADRASRYNAALENAADEEQRERDDVHAAEEKLEQ